jgi:hypothetical protein
MQIVTDASVTTYDRFTEAQRVIRPLVPLVNAAVSDFSLERCEDFIDAARRACETLWGLADPGVGQSGPHERDLYDAADAVACAAAMVALAAELAEGDGRLVYVDARILPFRGRSETVLCAARPVQDLWTKWAGRDLLDAWDRQRVGGDDA